MKDLKRAEKKNRYITRENNFNFNFNGMTSNPIKSDQNTDTPSVIIGPMPYSGPMPFPSFDFLLFQCLDYKESKLNYEIF